MGLMLTEMERRAVQHALGLTPRGGSRTAGRRWAYRNYYASGEADWPLWDGLVERGLAIRSARKPDAIQPFLCFHVTRAGVEAAGLGAYVPKHLAT